VLERERMLTELLFIDVVSVMAVMVSWFYMGCCISLYLTEEF